MQVFTVGHSNHSLDIFLGLLDRHGVTALADVRSAPRSRFNPHFNARALGEALRERGIAYVWLGRELGGRPDDPACYEDGWVSYPRLAATPLYREGVGRVMQGADRYRLALMCAERDPVQCHRALLVSETLRERGVEIAHILADGRLESQESVIDRLLAGAGDAGLPFEDPTPRAERISAALRSGRRKRKTAQPAAQRGGAPGR